MLWEVAEDEQRANHVAQRANKREICCKALGIFNHASLEASLMQLGECLLRQRPPASKPNGRSQVFWNNLVGIIVVDAKRNLNEILKPNSAQPLCDLQHASEWMRAERWQWMITSSKTEATLLYGPRCRMPMMVTLSILPGTQRMYCCRVRLHARHAYMKDTEVDEEGDDHGKE